MDDNNLQQALELAARHAQAYRRAPVLPRPEASLAELRHSFDIGLPEQGCPPREVIASLIAAAEPGLVGITSPQFYGWVMGASHPVGVAADWLTSCWGQNAGIYQTSPAAAVAEEVVASWLLDLLALPSESSVGFVSGATMASFVCLAAARSEVLKQVGWDLEQDGFNGAPQIQVVIGEEAHSTLFAGLRYLGFGARQLIRIASDRQGRMQTQQLAAAMAQAEGPTIVIAQAGHIHSGACDPLTEVIPMAQAAGAWVHIDGAFGLWARASRDRAALCAGAELADSWAVDGHKWLQLPYDAGYAIVKHAPAHQRAMQISASYLNKASDDGRTPSEWVPELSRRARGFAAWAVLRALGREGVRELIDRHCDSAAELAVQLCACEGMEVVNDVVLNQVALRFGDADLADAERDQLTQAVIALIQQDNDSFVSGARWQGVWIMRVSVISQHTGPEQITRLAAAITSAWQRVQRA